MSTSPPQSDISPDDFFRLREQGAKQGRASVEAEVSQRQAKLASTLATHEKVTGKPVGDISPDDFFSRRQASSAPFAWNAGGQRTAPRITSPAIAQPASQGESVGDKAHIAAPAYDPSAGQLGKDFVSTISKPARTIQAVKPRPPVRMFLPGQSNEELRSQAANTPSAIEEARRQAANQAISQRLGIPLPRVATEALADISGGLASGVGSAISGEAKPSVFNPLKSLALRIPSVQTALDNTVGKVGQELQERGAEASNVAGAPDGVRRDIGRSVGGLAPLLAARNPLAVAALTYDQARGQGASEAEAIKQGAVTGASVGAMGGAANLIGRAVPETGALAGATRIAGRTAANAAIGPLIEAPVKIAEGESPIPTTRQALAKLPMDVGFALLPHGKAQEPEAPAVDPLIEQRVMQAMRPPREIPNYSEGLRADRAQYEAKRAAQEMPQRPAPVQPTEAGVESAIQSGIGARQPLQSPRLVKAKPVAESAAPAQDIKQPVQSVEQASPLSFEQWEAQQKAAKVVPVGETGLEGLGNDVSNVRNQQAIPEPTTTQVGSREGRSPVTERLAGVQEARAAKGLTAPTVTTIRPSAPRVRKATGEADLIQYIRDNGGMALGKGSKGERDWLRESRLRQPGVFNEKAGMPWDDLEIQARVDGYLQADESLESALDRSARGEKIYTQDKRVRLGEQEMEAHLAAEHEAFLHDSPDVQAHTEHDILFNAGKDTEFVNLLNRLHDPDATAEDEARFYEAATQEHKLPDDLATELIEKATAKRDEQRGSEQYLQRPTQPNAQAGESGIGQAQRGAVRDAAKAEGDVNAARQATLRNEQSGVGQLPEREVLGAPRADQAGSGSNRPANPKSDDYSRVSGILETLKTQAKETGQNLSSLVEDRINQQALPGMEQTSLSSADADLLRQMAAPASRRAPVKESQSSLLDTSPTLESKQAQATAAEQTATTALANSPLFEGTQEPPHHSELQPRAEDGTFNGPPDYTLTPEKIKAPAGTAEGKAISLLYKEAGGNFFNDPSVKRALGLDESAGPQATHNKLRDLLGPETSTHKASLLQKGIEGIRQWAKEKGLPEETTAKLDAAVENVRLGGKVDDPDIIQRYRNDLGKKSGDLSASILSDPERGYKAVVVLGHDLYQSAKDFGSWAKGMVAQLGERIRPLLRDLWDGIKDSAFFNDERGFVRVDTPEFKRWFGKSKVVDEKGEPLPVYHGTQADFDSFEAGRNKAPDETGIFFTPDRAVASAYTGYDENFPSEKIGSVMPIYLKADNLKIVDFKGGKYGRGQAIATARDEGYDGVLLKNHYDAGGVQDQYVVFDPKQIKSATGNSGAFNPDSSSLTDPPFVGKVKQKLLDLFPGERPPLPPGFKDSEGGALLLSVPKRLYNPNQPGQITPALEAISTLRKAGLLTSIKTHLRNVLGTGAFQLTEELSRIPGSMLDLVASSVTGQRGLTGASPVAFAKAGYEAATKGVRDAIQIMKQGTPANNPAQVHAELNTRSPLLNAYANTVFRALSAEDKVMRVYAYRRALEGRAKAEALNEKRRNPSVDVTARTKQLVNAPHARLMAESLADAEMATFNNDNAWSTAIQNTRQSLRQGGGAGKATDFAIDMIMPFDRTPTNIMARMLEYTPGGAVYGLSRTAYRAAAAKLAGRAFTPQEQLQFARTFGRGMTGSALIALGYALAASGHASGVYDEDDKAANRLNKEAGRPPMAVKIGNKWLQIGGFSPLGNLIAIGATLFEKPDTSKMLIAKEALTEQPLLRGVNDLLSATKSGDKLSDKAGYMAGSFIPSAAADIAEATDDKSRKSFGFKGQIEKRIPGLRRSLPEDENVQHSRVWAVDPFRTTTEKDSPSAASVLAARKAQANMPAGGPMTPEKKERFELKKQITDLAKKGDMDGAVKAMAEGLKSGKLAESDAADIDERTKLDYLQYQVKKLSASDALSIYFDKRTTAEERERIAGIIEDKLNKFDVSKHPQREVDALMPQVMEFVKSRPAPAQK